MVESLVGNIGSTSQSVYIKDAAKVHHRLTQIHPFHDGNGRCARGLHNILMKYGHLPLICIDQDSTADYFCSLRKADLENNIDDLSIFFMRQELSADAKLHGSFLMQNISEE